MLNMCMKMQERKPKRTIMASILLVGNIQWVETPKLNSVEFSCVGIVLFNFQAVLHKLWFTHSCLNSLDKLTFFKHDLNTLVVDVYCLHNQHYANHHSGLFVSIPDWLISISIACILFFNTAVWCPHSHIKCVLLQTSMFVFACYRRALLLTR